MEKPPFDDIRLLLEYNWDDELDDYIDVGCNRGPDKNRIFLTLVAIRNWLDGTENEPDDYIPLSLRGELAE